MSAIARALVALHHRRVQVPRVERVGAALAKLLGPTESLLDVGAGDGSLARRVADRVGAARVEGVDVLLQPEPQIEVRAYDGVHLPYPDGAFSAVMLSDVLHHCERPERVFAEAIRVASRAVALKDHFRFGGFSQWMLLSMDRVGNAGPGIAVRGTYFNAREWAELVESAGARFADLIWPLQIHDDPIRRVTGDQLQFAARIEKR
jgi:ubiquinone/menaquinone biosynthesis C-methylase UbiE